MKPNWLMMAVAIGVRQCYWPFKVRVRQWGGLPANRGATVLITNHQFGDEGEIVISRVFLTHPWKRLVMVNSRRTFETGFFAARLPWTAPFMRHVNPTGLWERFSILPVENHLFSRTLLSLAEEIRGAHGDITLDDILPADRIAPLGVPGTLRLGELWSMANFFKAQTTVKVAYLKEPYRREALEHFRATSSADVARIVETIRDGATFYVTPEGDFSRDGTMHRMRGGITDAVLPVAQPWLCAIAYDPFRGKRLGMLYRILRAHDTSDLGTTLAAARPVTTSALLAAALAGRTTAFTSADAAALVRARLIDLPANAFVDPELQRDIAGCVNDALAGMVRLGTLRAGADSASYTLTGHHVDARFPHIGDTIAYHATMLAETVACARRLAEPEALAVSVTAQR
jgi:hypothetical protein